jgi:hypothetical protein
MMSVVFCKCYVQHILDGEKTIIVDKRENTVLHSSNPKSREAHVCERTHMNQNIWNRDWLSISKSGANNGMK